MKAMTWQSLLGTIAVGLAIGCTSEPPAPPVSAGPAAGHDHAHPHEGPHGGHLIELGEEEYHAELVHDDATHTVTIYLLDGAAKNAVAVDATELALNLVADGKPQQFALAARPSPGDAPGQSSRFESADETLCEALDKPKTTGRLNITIAGTPYVGQVESLEEHGHAHEPK